MTVMMPTKGPAASIVTRASHVQALITAPQTRIARQLTITRAAGWDRRFLVAVRVAGDGFGGVEDGGPSPRRKRLIRVVEFLAMVTRLQTYEVASGPKRLLTIDRPPRDFGGWQEHPRGSHGAIASFWRCLCNFSRWRVN